MIRSFVFCAVFLAAAACNQPPANAPDESATTRAFAGIGEHETVHFLGNEPFWGGQISDGEATYTTPEDLQGTRFAVQRFAGNAGLGFSGQMAGRSFDLAVTRGQCSDGMSDRTYPFTATLRIGEEGRNGCAWTDSHPFTGMVDN